MDNQASTRQTTAQHYDGSDALLQQDEPMQDTSYEQWAMLAQDKW